MCFSFPFIYRPGGLWLAVVIPDSLGFQLLVRLHRRRPAVAMAGLAGKVEGDLRNPIMILAPIAWVI